VVQQIHSRLDGQLGDLPEVCAFREELPQQSICVLIDSPFPGCVRSREIGVCFQGFSDPLMLDKFRPVVKFERVNLVLIRGQDSDGSTRLSSDLALAEGTNLVVLAISRPGGSGDNTYSLWLNPTVGENPGAADWSGTLDFGIVVDSGSHGFYGFSMNQRFNGEQSVLADEFRFGTTFDSVTPIPEPGSLVLVAVGLIAALGLRSRRRRG